MYVLWEISFSFQWLKNSENRLKFVVVTAMSLVVPFLRHDVEGRGSKNRIFGVLRVSSL